MAKRLQNVWGFIVDVFSGWWSVIGSLSTGIGLIQLADSTLIGGGWWFTLGLGIVCLLVGFYAAYRNQFVRAETEKARADALSVKINAGDDEGERLLREGVWLLEHLPEKYDGETRIAHWIVERNKWNASAYRFVRDKKGLEFAVKFQEAEWGHPNDVYSGNTGAIRLNDWAKFNKEMQVFEAILRGWPIPANPQPVVSASSSSSSPSASLPSSPSQSPPANPPQS